MYNAFDSKGFVDLSEIPKLLELYANQNPRGVDAIRAITRNPDWAELSLQIQYLLNAFPTGNMVHYALVLAADCRDGQMYASLAGDVPHLSHLIQVSTILLIDLKIADPKAIVSALWHDIIEDHRISEQQLELYIHQTPSFSPVTGLFDISTEILNNSRVLSRSEPYNAPLYYEGLGKASPQIRLVKAADLICNTRSLIAIHQAVYKQKNRAVAFRLSWVPKYTTEVACYVLNQKSFAELPQYPSIHNTLLSILVELSDYLERQYPEQLSILEEFGARDYQASYFQSLARLRSIQPIPNGGKNAADYESDIV